LIETGQTDNEDFMKSIGLRVQSNDNGSINFSMRLGNGATVHSPGGQGVNIMKNDKSIIKDFGSGFNYTVKLQYKPSLGLMIMEDLFQKYLERSGLKVPLTVKKDPFVPRESFTPKNYVKPVTPETIRNQMTSPGLTW